MEVRMDEGEMDDRYEAGFAAGCEYASWSAQRRGATATTEEAALVRRVLATTGYAAPMHDRHEARRIVDRVLPPMPDTGRGRGEPLAFGDAANC